MKLLIFSVISIILIIWLKSTDNEVKKKRNKRAINNECYFVNSLLKENELYDCCSNKQIKCKDNHIIEIRLDNSYIKNKTLPNSVGSMPYIEVLDVSNCGLNGTIPEDIGNLTNLKYLVSDINKLTGTIPASIGKLTKLEYLGLSFNNLSGEIPTKELEKLSVAVIIIGGNKNLYGKIPNIQYKETDQFKVYCYFGKTNLCYSEDEKNPLCIYPKTHYNCSTCVSNSELDNTDGVCKCKEGFQGIGYIKCKNKVGNNQDDNKNQIDDNKKQGDDNKIQGDDNKKQGDDNKIQGDDNKKQEDDNKIQGDDNKKQGDDNKIQGDDNKMKKKLNKRYVNEECYFVNSLFKENELYDCCLNEEIKCKDNHIIEIRLDNSYIKNKTLPNSVGSMPYIEVLDISNCGLNGTIPEDIGNLTNLKYLALDHNEFISTIPASIGKLNKLELLNLSFNNLSGEIPTKELEKLSVAVIGVGGNQNLYGKIPNIQYKETDEFEIDCYFDDTKLCYSEDKMNSLCSYSKTQYNCSNCVSNSELDNTDGVCKCKEGFQGIGYIKCKDK
eukprot:jgi/Orpsp1_1/1186103/evm.model.c7180000096894.1